MERLDACLLTGVGVLAVHQAAYTASSFLGAESTVGHGHLAVAWLVGGSVAVAGLARSVARSLRRRHHTPMSLPIMALWIGLGYVGMEWAERLVDGSSTFGLAGEAVFWLGLAATPVVALALRSMSRSVNDLAQLLLSARTRPRWRPTRPTSLGYTSVELAPLSLRSDSVSRRGPPGRLHT